MWRALTGPYFAGSGVFRHICTSCAPDIYAADDLVDAAPWRLPMPSVAPPAPPRPTKVEITHVLISRKATAPHPN